ncbi:MAG: gluconokinase [Firmicutes bacterium]|nr:gluconokinase [Bacillota bacterium]
MGFVIGVDIGTGGCRVLAFDEKASVVASAKEEYPTFIPRPGWAEQDPEQIYQAVARALRRCLDEEPLRKAGSKAIDGVAFDGVLHSVIVGRPTGELITRAITWADLRADGEARLLKRQMDADEFYRRTGCPIHPMYLPAKLLWLQNHVLGSENPRSYRFFSLKEYVLYRLTGRWLVDWSVASGTGLLNLATLRWDHKILDRLGVRAEEFSEPVSPLAVVEGITAEAAAETGLPRHVRVVVGAADGPVSNLGYGVVDKRSMTLTIGTSGAVRTTSDQPLLDPAGRTWCYYLAADRWVPGGATNNGGNVLTWLKDAVFGAQCEGSGPETRGGAGTSFEDLNAAAASVPAGSDGLLFLTFLAGERCPGWNPQARGVLFGLNLSHGKAHIVRAALEGAVFQLYGSYSSLTQLSGVPEEIIASGGFTRSDVWLQIAADIFGHELIIPEQTEGSAFGVAALARVALGQWPDLEVVRDFVQVKRRIAPNPVAHRRYMELYEQYEAVYQALSPQFAAIADLQNGGRHAMQQW